MSTFGTFLTNGPYRRNRGKPDFHQRFLRENNKFFPKAIRPKVSVNVNPVVQYMTNKHNGQHQKPDTSGKNTMKYKNCSQIVPTVGLTNLVFYDCHKKRSTARSIDDSISKLMTPSDSQETGNIYGSDGSQFFVPDVLLHSDRSSLGIIGDTTNKSQEWMADNFDDFLNVPQTLSDRSVQDFTFAYNGRSSFLSNVVNSYTSFEMDLNRLAYDKDISNDIPHSDNLSFGLNLNDPTNQLSDNVVHLDDDTFEMNLNRQASENIISLTGTDSLNASGYCSELNSTDWQMTSIVSHSEDESMEKFDVSSCSDITLEISGERDFYAQFLPLLTSTPLSRSKRKTRNNANNEMSGLLDISGEELFLNQQEQVIEPTANFTLSGKTLFIFSLLFRRFFFISKVVNLRIVFQIIS